MILIPAAIYALGWLIMIIATVCEEEFAGSTHHNIVECIGGASALTVGFGPVPCMIIAAIGVSYMGKACLGRVRHASAYCIIGIIEVIAFSVITYKSWVMVAGYN